MIKFFSNTILSYLEKDINTFLTTTNCQVISIHYSTTIEDNPTLKIPVNPQYTSIALTIHNTDIVNTKQSPNIG